MEKADSFSVEFQLPPARGGPLYVMRFRVMAAKRMPKTTTAEYGFQNFATHFAMSLRGRKPNLIFVVIAAIVVVVVVVVTIVIDDEKERSHQREGVRLAIAIPGDHGKAIPSMF